MVLSYFGYIISIVILISGLQIVEPDKSSCIDTTEFESQNPVYNVFCNFQNCTEPCKKDILESIATKVKEQKYSNVLVNINTDSMHLNSNISFLNHTSLTINGRKTINATTISCNSSVNSGAGIVLT